jgi:hypothetical protein
MYLFNHNRFALLELLPTGLITAEIGVAVGDFSEGILRVARPNKLHLIDPWRHIDKADYLGDENNTDDAQGEQRYAAVKSRFAPAIDTGQVVVHRAYSYDVAEQFPDEYFDWVYVDADHTYRGCLTDLELFDRKVKRGGLILGHDYTNEATALRFHFGVVDAVNEFVGLRDYHLAALTMEPFPTFVIAKDRSSPLLSAFTENLYKAPGVLIEIRDAEIRNYRMRFGAAASARRTVMSFG